MTLVKESNPAENTVQVSQASPNKNAGALNENSEETLKNDQGQILVYIRVKDVSEPSIQALREIVASIVHVSKTYLTVTAYVSPERLEKLNALPVVLNVQKAPKPETNRREGDAGGAIAPSSQAPPNKKAGSMGESSEETLKNDQGQILVYIRVKDVSEPSIQALREIVASIVHVSKTYLTVTAYVNPERLEKLNVLPVVLNVQKAIRPVTNRQQGASGGAITPQ
ncbi:MAG: hypothetical protein HQK55_02300 [Deltaproteobacteria bacterium]|nr:hypothetical protein [Deltaproteobacteria bacterium]